MSEAASTLVFRELRLRQFRNFSELELTFPAPGVVIIGENGAGKTNLLEAIYYLEIFRSFRGAPDEQLVRFGAQAFHARGRFQGGPAGQLQEVTAAFELRGRRKRVTQNGVESERLGAALGGLGAVIFSPADVGLVRGSPAERRRFLDIVLSLNRPGYLAALQRYRQVLRQRNAALRDARSASAMHAWDDALVDSGTDITIMRSEWVAENREAFARRYRSISGGVTAHLRYACAVTRRAGTTATILNKDQLRDAFQAELQRVSLRERERGATLVGPHRDELALSTEGASGEIDLREFGSGGQVRTAAVALRMVEADTIRTRRARNPLILLDDVFAELDRARSERILELLESEQPGQVILTAPKESDLQVRHGQLPRWRMEEGQIHV
ncbi:MAG: DNA replication/repair protein RecF [Longimicrobiales bacterium]